MTSASEAMSQGSFPYLLEIASDRSYPLHDQQAVTFGGPERADVVIEDAPPDELLFRIEREGEVWFLQPLGSAADVRVDWGPVGRRTSLVHLTIIQARRRVFVFVARQDAIVSNNYLARLWLLEQLPDRPRGMRDLNVTATIPISDLLTAARSLDLPDMHKLPERRMLIGRDSERAEICLPDIRVSRVHAAIVREGRTATITDLNSVNGTFVDGRPIRQPTIVRPGSRIQIGPYSLLFRGNALYPLSHQKDVELAALHLTRRVPDSRHGSKWKVILDDVSLVVRPREFVCILGPSGSGKTTLLSALSARVRADEGTVLLNGENLYAHFESLKQNLAVVPQRDVLHDVLPLQIALWYTAKMRLPTDMSPEDVAGRIDETLDAVNLVQHQYRRIRELSGGQAKRASWANEAICNPSLIYLDEVTSGLDEQTDAEMMSLFRRMADGGKTLICVTHSLGNVEQNCHLVAILAQGGALAFCGPPAAAKQYFGIAKLGDVYQRLNERPPEEWKQRFRGSEYYREYVERRLPDSVKEEVSYVDRRAWTRELRTGWQQFTLLTRRYFAIQWAQKRALWMMLGQSLFIAALLVWLFGDITQLDVQDEARHLAEVAAPGVAWSELLSETQEEFLAEAEKAKRADLTSRLLFLLCVSCIWFGCNNAAKEIVKERAIYSKERDVGLKLSSYYASKLFLLGVFSILQVSLLYGIVRFATHLGGDHQQQWLLLSLSSLTGVAMGLAISALSNTEDLAVTIVPIALIPQIVLAGLIAPLLHYTRVFSRLFVSAYWSYQGVLMTLDEPVQTRLRGAECLDLQDVWTLPAVCYVLAAHVLIFALVALVVLHLRDMGQASSLPSFSLRRLFAWRRG